MIGLGESFNRVERGIFALNYTPLQTNSTTTLERARIIVLPEAHYLKSDMERNAWIINKLWRRGDVVLVESPQENLESYFQTEYVGRPVTLHGWDCAESDAALHRAKQPFYDLRIRADALNYSGDEFNRLLVEAIRTCPATQVEKDHLVRRLTTINEQLPVTRRRGELSWRVLFTFSLIRSIENFHERNGELGAVYERTFSVRQEKLIDTCRRYASDPANPTRRVFVIAGASHVLRDRAWGAPFFNRGVDRFHEFLRTYPSVILDHDRRPTWALRLDVKKDFTLFKVKKTVAAVISKIQLLIARILAFLRETL